MSRFFLVLLLMLFASFPLKAQHYQVNYLPNDLDVLEDYLEHINNNFIDKIEGKHSSKVKKVFKKKDEKIFRTVKDSAYSFIPAIDQKMDAITQEIYQTNPSINSANYQFFIKNSIVPNAACYGDGMFEINLGLLTSLEYDDELAFILCHEIAHKLLNHSMKKVKARVTTLNSNETKQRIRKLKRTRYGQSRAALLVMNELSVDFLNHSQEAEMQADSLGFVLLSKTKYNTSKSISSLRKLQREEDDLFFSYRVKLDSVFDHESYPFQEYWLEEEQSLFDVSEKINDFSLTSKVIKTHPETEERIQKIKSDFKLKSLDSISGDTTHIKSLEKIANFHSIQYTIDLNFLDLAIYQLIEKYDRKIISEEYYYAKMASVLKILYEARENHHLGKYIPHKNNLSEEEHLNTIRLFLHNLELSEIKKIGWAFCEAHKAKLSHNQEFMQTYHFFKNLNL